MTNRNDPPRIYTSLDYPQAFEMVKNTLALCPIGTKGFWQIRACDPQQSIIQAAMSFSGFVNSAFPDARANVIMDIVFGFAFNDIGVADGTVYIKLKYSVFGFPLPLGVEQAIDMTTKFIEQALSYSNIRQASYQEYELSANSKIKQGDYQGAIQDCTQMISINPLSPNARMLRGDAYMETGNYKLASVDLECFIRYLPKNTDNYITLIANACFACGFAYFKQGMYQPAMIKFSKVIELDSDANTHFNRGILNY